MQKHLINYDLNAPVQNYDTLIEAIKAYGEWAKISQSCWAVKTNETDEEIRDKLRRYIDHNDVIFVCAFDGWFSQNLPNGIVSWLKNN